MGCGLGSLAAGRQHREPVPVKLSSPAPAECRGRRGLSCAGTQGRPRSGLQVHGHGGLQGRPRYRPVPAPSCLVLPPTSSPAPGPAQPASPAPLASPWQVLALRPACWQSAARPRPRGNSCAPRSGSCRRRSASRGRAPAAVRSRWSRSRTGRQSCGLRSAQYRQASAPRSPEFQRRHGQPPGPSPPSCRRSGGPCRSSWPAPRPGAQAPWAP
mmetsp:Transcript_111771/g.360821  ORF Transcript_111771/g.360821 Transcript_111771/m.360821 type:complete len:213 (+) Transcript_111771:37-675(+)